jgi:hypothetical protein
MKQDNTMTEEMKSPDLSSLPLVMVRALELCGEPWRKARLIRKDLALYWAVTEDDDELNAFAYCKPHTPPVRRPMTHAEIFAAIRAGAVVRGAINHFASNFWSAIDSNIAENKICYNYTGTDSDVWQDMTVEEVQ